MVNEEINYFDHLLPEVGKIALCCSMDRIKYLQTEHWIGYPKAMLALEKLEALLGYPQRARMPNLLLVGATNNGKTMILEKFYRKYVAPLKTEGQGEFGHYTELPVLLLQMPSNPDIRRFYAAIYNNLGIPLRTGHMRAAELEADVLRYLKLLKTKILIIDEIHNILAGRSDNQREFLNVLRYLGNELRIPLVCVGIRDAYLALRSDLQLENRFEPFLLPAWGHGRDYESLLASFVKLMPLHKASQLTSPGIADKILARSEGILGEISTIVRRAAEKAIKTREEQITEKTIESLDYMPPSERKKIFEREII